MKPDEPKAADKFAKGHEECIDNAAPDDGAGEHPCYGN